MGNLFGRGFRYVYFMLSLFLRCNVNFQISWNQNRDFEFYIFSRMSQKIEEVSYEVLDGAFSVILSYQYPRKNC